MNKYLIQHKIKTLSYLSVGIENGNNVSEMRIDDFVFNNWDNPAQDGRKSEAWIVKKVVDSDSYIVAINKFRKDLDVVIQKLAFCSQCYMDFYFQPFLIYKLNDNTEMIFIYEHFKERIGVGLQFGKIELENYKKISSYKYPVAFKFLQECCNTTSYIPKLLLLFAALEAMCGVDERTKENGEIFRTYNQEIMKKILDNRLYNELYGKNGLRHKLSHGEFMDNISEKNYFQILYNKIIEYLDNECDCKTNRDVVHPQRHPHGNYERGRMCLIPIKKGADEIDIKKCTDFFSNNINTVGKYNPCERKIVDTY